MRNLHQKENELATKQDLQISYHWSAEPLTFGSFKPEDLSELITKQALALGISATEATKIRIHLADHLCLKVSGQPFLCHAYCLPELNTRGKYRCCHVVLNRSRELFYHQTTWGGTGTNNRWAETKRSPDGELLAALNSEREIISWLIIEELNHAQVFLRSKNENRQYYWRDNYKSHISDKSGEYDPESYNYMLTEVTAARHALRLLSKQARQIGQEDRAAYFHGLYLESLTERRAVLPSYTRQLAERVFIPTGFTR